MLSSTQIAASSSRNSLFTFMELMAHGSVAAAAGELVDNTHLSLMTSNTELIDGTDTNLGWNSDVVDLTLAKLDVL